MSKRQLVDWSEEIEKSILKLREDGYGKKEISKILNVSRRKIENYCKNVGLFNTHPLKKIKENPTSKICIICKTEKDILNFKKASRKTKQRILYYHSSYCDECRKEDSKKREKENRIANPEKYRERDKIKSETLERKLWAKKYSSKRIKERKKDDPVFNMRLIISQRVRSTIKNNNGIKNNSFLQKIGYSLNELKTHIEKQFEPWMNWNNWGQYIKSEWDDNNSSTWRWNIDHIIPHSNFQYKSMDEQSFKDCWALSNLRPLSAKQNIKDGKRR